MGKIYIPPEIPATRPRRNLLVPLGDLPGIEEIDAILRPVIKAGRKEVHAAIGSWRDVRVESAESCGFASAKLGKRGGCLAGAMPLGVKKICASPHTYYARGRAGARRAVKGLRARHPRWNPCIIWHKAAKLGISSSSGEARPWSREEHGDLLWTAGEKPVGSIARKLGRSEKAVRPKLSSRGAASKVRTLIEECHISRESVNVAGVEEKPIVTFTEILNYLSSFFISRCSLNR